MKIHKVHQQKLSSNNFKSTTTFENKSAAWRGAHSYSRWAATAQSQIYPRPCLFPQYVLTSALHSLTLTCEQALLPVLWAQRQESSSKSTTGAARSCGCSAYHQGVTVMHGAANIQFKRSPIIEGGAVIWDTVLCVLSLWAALLKGQTIWVPNVM